MLLRLAPACAAVLDRPVGRNPALGGHDLVPANEVFALQTLVIEYFVLKISRQAGLQPSANFLSKRQFLWRVVQIHAASVRFREALNKFAFYGEPAQLCDAGINKIKALVLLILPQKFLHLFNQRFFSTTVRILHEDLITPRKVS
jgi:hypothetical protein